MHHPRLAVSPVRFVRPITGLYGISDSQPKNTELLLAIIDLRDACGFLAIVQIRWLLTLRFLGPGTPTVVSENVRRPGCPSLPYGDGALGSLQHGNLSIVCPS